MPTVRFTHDSWWAEQGFYNMNMVKVRNGGKSDKKEQQSYKKQYTKTKEKI